MRLTAQPGRHLILRRREVFGWHVLERKPRARCVLITTRSASSRVPSSILAQREGHARGGEGSALPGKPNWSKRNFPYDSSGVNAELLSFIKS